MLDNLPVQMIILATRDWRLNSIEKKILCFSCALYNPKNAVSMIHILG